MRQAYIDQLDSVIEELVAMTYDVRDSIALASKALLHADVGLAERVISGDTVIDAARERVESRAFELLALQQPVARDLRMLVAGLRMAGDLERMGDHSVHVAKVARRRMPDVAVPTELLPTMLRMAEVADVEPAVDIALLGRFYERIADHAVSLARRVVFLVTGAAPLG